MTDIVERLRWWAYKFCGKGVQEDDASDVMTNAIHEIENLRAALRGVLTYYNAPTPAEAKLKKAVLATPIEQARAALGEKE